MKEVILLQVQALVLYVHALGGLKLRQAGSAALVDCGWVFQYAHLMVGGQNVGM